MEERREDHRETRIEQATESTFAKFLARFLTPILLSVVAWFGVGKLSDIQSAQSIQAIQQQQQALQIQGVSSEVKLLNAKVEFSILQQITENRRRIELLESQGRVLRIR